MPARKPGAAETYQRMLEAAAQRGDALAARVRVLEGQIADAKATDKQTRMRLDACLYSMALMQEVLRQREAQIRKLDPQEGVWLAK